MRMPSGLLVFCLVLCAVASSCGLLDPNDFGDFGEDENGNLIMLDTRRNWSMWTYIVDDEVANEVRNERPPAGAPTWESYWLSLIEEQQEGRENKERYTDYILDARRRAGLQPLPIETISIELGTAGSE